MMALTSATPGWWVTITRTGDDSGPDIHTREPVAAWWTGGALVEALVGGGEGDLVTAADRATLLHGTNGAAGPVFHDRKPPHCECRRHCGPAGDCDWCPTCGGVILR